MQLSKVLLVLGATTVSLIPLAGRAADNASVAPLVAPTPSNPDAVEKARAALHQKMDELQPAAPAATAPAAAAQAPAKSKSKPKSKTKAAPAVAPAPTQATAAPSPFASPSAPTATTQVIPVADPASLDRAREALHQKMSDLNSQPSPKATKVVATSTPQAEASKVVLTKEQPKAAQATKEAKKPANKPAPAAKPVVAKTGLNFEPLSAPPSPLSETKQQRLSELLGKYKADQITPEQYHQERAKILTEP